MSGLPFAARSRRQIPPALLAIGILIGIAAAIPAAYLLVVVADDPAGAVSTVFTSRSGVLTLETLALTAAVSATSVAIGLPLAWLTARTDLPARRLWTTLTVLPLVIPSYIGAYLLISTLGPVGLLRDFLGVERMPSIYGFAGAWLALSLFTYPLVLLAVRATLMRLDPQLEDAARVMGRSRRETFISVVLPQLVPSIAAGALLVALYVVSDFGAVSIMRFDSLSREIYVTYQSSFNRSSAASLGLVLVLITLALLVLQARVSGAFTYHRASPGTAHAASIVPLGRWRLPALAFCTLITTVSLFVPLAVLIYWAADGLAGDGLAAGDLIANGSNSLLAASAAALVAGFCAVVVAVLAVRFRSRTTTGLERMSYAGYAPPGVVVALSLVYFGIRVAPSLYQTLAMLVFALSFHYLPLAVGSVGSSLLQVSPRVEEAARGLGRGPLEVFRTITTPLVASGIAAGMALVFLHAMKELPATLLLAPIGFETLATDIWRQTTRGFFEAGAIPTIALLIIAAPPLFRMAGRGIPPAS